MRVFYVIYVYDEPYRTILNGMRVLANPKEKHSAHVTVQGPFSRRRNESTLNSLNQLISGKEISVEGAGHFFEPGQNTVFLRCVSEELRSIWRKPQYGYNPHITIYDGDCRELADRILASLVSADILFKFTMKRLEELVINGQRDLALAYSIDYALLESYAECRLDQASLSRMDPSERHRLIGRLASFLAREPSALSMAGSR